MNSVRPEPQPRTAFGHFQRIPTRWMDNDVYGHINNVVYYAYFDTLINRYLIDHCGLDFQSDPIIAVAVETTCRFHRSFAYPDEIDAGLAIGRLGSSSVRYDIGLFGANDDLTRADGHFVHVFVARQTMRPTPIPTPMRTGLKRLLRAPAP